MLFRFRRPNLEELKKKLQLAIDRLSGEVKRRKLKGRYTTAELHNAVAAKNKNGNSARMSWLASELIDIHNMVDVLEMLLSTCQSLSAEQSLPSITSATSGMKSHLSNLLYSSKRLDLYELRTLSQLFARIYGSRFTKNAEKNAWGLVNGRIVSKLSSPVSNQLVEEYLTAFRECRVPPPRTSPRQTSDQDIRKELASTRVHDTKDRQHISQLPVPASWKPIRPKSLEGTNKLSQVSPTPLPRVPSSSIATDKRISPSLSPALPIRLFHPNPFLEIAFDVRTKNPLYVLERLGVSQFVGSKNGGARSHHTFFEEAALPEMYRSKLSCFVHSGYDRGHMAPAADFGAELVKDTFTLCNVSPQVHELNCSTWVKLEHWCRRLAKSEEMSATGGSTYVVTGPLWMPKRRVSDKKFEYDYPAIGQLPCLVKVSTHFFKVVAVISHEMIQGYACFVVPNEPGLNTATSLSNFETHWEDLEAWSGLHFFPALTLLKDWKRSARKLASYD